MASKLSDNNGRKNTTLLIGIGVVVVIVALVVVTYPPGSDGFSGTIGKPVSYTHLTLPTILLV